VNFLNLSFEAGQNNDYSAGYSTGNLQGRKQQNYPKTQKQSLNLNENINNQECRKTPTSRANIAENLTFSRISPKIEKS
jgi:hypothetical protein